MTDHVHADRRTPTPPDGALDLLAAAEELIAQAHSLDAGRAARTLTPGAGAPLKQTVLALAAGRRLDEHRANGPATIQVLRGEVTLGSGDGEVELSGGQWAVIPDGPHDLVAHSDAALLLTVAPTPR